MLDPMNESTGTNYAKRDGASDLLWTTQRSKVNPWEHRGQSDSDGQEHSRGRERPAPAGTDASPMIGQHDTLKLDPGVPDEVPNPFEKLIEHQLQVRLPGAGNGTH